MTTDAISPDYSAAELLAEWGFSKHSPAGLRQHAQQCAQFSNLKIGEIVVALGLATQEVVERAVGDKPSNVLTLEHVSSALPSLQEHFLKVLAVSRRMPYLSALQDSWLEAGRNLPDPAKARLDELSATYVTTPDGVPLIVFSDLGSLLKFSQEGRIQQEQDPIRGAVGKEVGLALAAPSVLARAAQSEGSTEAHRVVSASAQDNFWAGASAKTEGERILARLLDEALSRKATDLAFAPMRDGTTQVRFRVYGDMLSPSRNNVLNPSITREITNFLISRSRAGDGGRLRKAADGQLTYKNASSEVFIRASFIPADRFGLDFDMISTSLRLLPRTAKSISLESLNLHSSVTAEVRKALVRSQGLIVLAGPTNSGKSTSIAGVVGEHYKMFGEAKKRLSLEDPVERYLEGISQITVEGNFAELVRSLLRHDPDMVWIGEIRDAFSASACVRAATSGHVVLSTVHANNAILAFRAIANYLRKDTGEATGGGASLFDLAESVSLLIGQRLTKNLCPHCRQKHTLSDSDRELAKQYLLAEGQPAVWAKAEPVLEKQVYRASETGCKRCDHTGYAGEVPINEVLPVTREVKELLAKSETRLDMTALGKHRLNTLAEHALELLEEGKVEFESLFI